MNQTDYLAANSAMLEQHHPAAWEKVAPVLDRPAGELTATPGGLPNLRLQGQDGAWRYCHPMPDPRSDLDYFRSLVPEDSTAVVICLGMGLGYVPLALIRERSHIQHLVICEPRADIFVQAMRSLDLTALLTDSRVAIHIDPPPHPEAVLHGPVVRAIQLEHTHILRHVPSFDSDPGYQEWNDRIYAFCNRLNVGGATLVKKGVRFMTNRFRNLTAIRHHRLLEPLVDLCKGKPAFLVAAGPSLDKNVRQLKEVEGRAVILAVDSALPVLLGHGIRPDFVVSVDPDGVVYEKIASSAPEATGVSLICQNGVTSRIPKNFPADTVFWAFAENDQEKWIRQLLGGKVVMDEAHANTHVALYAALIMGATPIVFVGQDLAYGEGRTHAANTVLAEEQWMIDKAKDRQDLLEVEGVDGGRVLTSRSFYGVKIHAEKIIAAHPDRLFLDATEGGARIQGTEVVPLADVIRRFCPGDRQIGVRVRERIASSAGPRVEALVDGFNSMRTRAENCLRRVGEIEGLPARVRQAIEESAHPAGCRGFGELPAAIQEMIRQLDRANADIDSDQELWLLVAETTLDGLRDTVRMQQEIDRLAGQPDRYLDWLALHMDRFDVLNKARAAALDRFRGLLEETVQALAEEKRLLAALDGAAPEKRPQALAALIRHYFAHDDVALARRWVDEGLRFSPDDPDFHMYRGMIAARQNDFEAMAHWFQLPMADDSRRGQIESFLDRIAGEYLEDGRLYRQEFDKATARRLLLKGLRYVVDHADLGREIAALADEDLAALSEARQQGTLVRQEGMLHGWIADLEAGRLDHCLSARQRAGFFHLAAELARHRRDWDKAVALLQQALSLVPEEAEYHAVFAATLIELGFYGNAIEHLKRAVSLDTSFAGQWEEIGDLVASSGQYSEAISAYEAAFVALPEQAHLLGKMAACYRAQGFEEAARTAEDYCRQLSGDTTGETGYGRLVQ